MATTHEAISSLENTRASHALPKKWDFNQCELEEEFFKAFERGENFQKKSTEEKMRKEVEQLLQRALYLSENFFGFLKNTLKVDVKKLMLNISEFPTFEALFIIPKNVFLSAEMKEVYNESGKLKSKFNDDKFRIDFKFMIESESIDNNLLDSDGFRWTYVDGEDEEGIS